MQRLREVIRTSLARSLRRCAEEDRLAAALPVVCGGALASHCELLALSEDGMLRLRVDRGEWLAPLLAMGDILQHDLQRVSGVSLTGVHFREADGADQPRLRERTRRVSLAPEQPHPGAPKRSMQGDPHDRAD